MMLIQKGLDVIFRITLKSSSLVQVDSLNTWFQLAMSTSELLNKRELPSISSMKL